MNQHRDNLCPFCKTDNHCKAHSQTPCWCGKVTFPAELLALVPAEQVMKSCICKTCIQAFQQNPKAFTEKYSESV